MPNLENNSTLNYNDRLVSIKQGELTQLRRDLGRYKFIFEIKQKRIQKIIDLCRTLKGEKRILLNRLFGKKSESPKSSEKGKDPTKPPKKRGKQKGEKGFGRKKEDQLPTAIETLDLDDNEKKCSCCGCEFSDLNQTSDSEIIEVEVKAHRRIIKRKTYEKTCTCEKTPAIIRPNPAPKVILKGKYGVSFWAYIICQKFCYHLPINRIVKQLASLNLNVSSGTISDGLVSVGKLLVPVYDIIGDRNKSENHWNADETRWKVFNSHKDKKGNTWYVWVFCSETTVYYKICSTRGASVVADHYKDSFGIISADRYVAYKTLLVTKLFLIAYCWAHVRRDFLEVEKGYDRFSDWAKSWVFQIGLLYHINNERVTYEVGTLEFNKCHELLVVQTSKMRSQLDNERTLYKEEFPKARYKVLESLNNHWHGLVLFVQFSWLPMDNNRAEREGRDPVLGRKNYYGSGSVEASEMAHMSFTLISTMELWGLRANLWFASYLQACAENNGKPPIDLRPFLPWLMTDKELTKMGRRTENPLPQKYSNITKEEIECATVDEAFLKKKSKTLKRSSKRPPSQNQEDISQEKFVKNLTG